MVNLNKEEWDLLEMADKLGFKYAYIVGKGISVIIGVGNFTMAHILQTCLGKKDSYVISELLREKKGDI